MTIFVRIKERFPIRALEWFCAFLILMLGWSMLISQDSFTRPSMQSFNEIMPGIAWALSLLTIGFVRVVSLVINGNKTIVTLPLRWVGSILGASIFGFFVGRFSSSMEDSSVLLILVTFTSLVMAEVYNTLRIAQEAKDSLTEEV